MLELGTDSGALWSQNIYKVLAGVNIVLLDISEGMLADTKNEIGESLEFQYTAIDV